MPPAARITDMHTCPMVTGIVPHVGGPILPPCAPTVLIGFLPAARVTDMCLCVGPPDVIVKGSPTVLINNLLAARIGDNTAHGGVIVLGCPTVIIGEQGAGSTVSAAAGAAVAGAGGTVEGAMSASQPGGGTAVAGAGGTVEGAVSGSQPGGGAAAEAALGGPIDVGPVADAFRQAATAGSALVCKGPCDACGHV